MHKSQRLINHVALVLDGSGSMQHQKPNVIKVADEQIRYLAQRSEDLSQETRVSVYVFDDVVECLLFDMDVMRLPSIADLYRVRGMTALIDAAIKSQQDLSTTSQLYGDHAFLTFILTDGGENRSRNTTRALSQVLDNADENWSIGWLVPNAEGRGYVQRLGVSSDSIAIWDASSAKGMLDAGNKIRTATDNFMAGRATGIRGTRSVFGTGADVVNRSTVAHALRPLTTKDYALYDVPAAARIDEFVKGVRGSYVRGTGYYQLTKTETIQATKQIIVVERLTGRAYSGQQARDLIGLPSRPVRVKPDYNPEYDIYVQSTSINRKLMPKTRLLVKA